MIDRGLIDKPVFAFYLSKTVGEMPLGGIDSKHYTGDLVNIPLSGDIYWQVELMDMKVGRSQIAFESNKAFLTMAVP